jgi:predicted permease
MKRAWRIYRRLAEAFPHEFKLAFGADMMQLGKDAIDGAAGRNGSAGLLHLLADIALRLPAEYLSEMRRDMMYAGRALVKSPGFAFVGIVSMGLGIGLTTNVYSSEWAMLSRPLAGAANAPLLAMPDKPLSYFDIEQFRSEQGLFSGVAALQPKVPFNVTLDGGSSARPDRVFGQLVSPDFFSVLGVRAQRGRMLNALLDVPGESPVVVISNRFWRNRLNSTPFAVGQAIRLNGQTATIVGIAPQRFDGAGTLDVAELFVPTTVPASLAPELGDDVLHRPNAKQFMAMICLKPGVSIDSAEAALDTILRRLDAQNPSAASTAAKFRHVTLLPAGTRAPIPRKLRPVITVFFVVLMGLVVSIACMNLATMLLARGANRRKELAIRLSVGASRFRLIRQLLGEGILLSLLGGAAGFALAWGLSLLNSRFQADAASPALPDFSLDWHAAVFAFVISVACGIGFSLLPALQATRSDLAPALKEGPDLRLPGYRIFGLRNLAMTAQVGASLMLLLITGFLIIGESRANDVDARFDPGTMALASIDPVRDGYSGGKAQAFFDSLPRRFASAGAIRGFALAAQEPFSAGDDHSQFTVDDPAQSSPVEHLASHETVGAGFFAVVNEPLLAGREFNISDQRLAAPEDAAAGSKPPTLPVVVNEHAALAFFGTDHAIGKRLRDGAHSYEVVGLVRDLRDGGGLIKSIVYFPLLERDFARPPAAGIVILARGDAGSAPLDAIRGRIAAVDPRLTLFSVQSLSDYLYQCQDDLRFTLRTYGGIGLFGLILAAIGLAGVTAYAVAQRRKEIGIRMALGARKGQVLGLVLREGAALVAAGTILGFLGAFLMVKLLSAFTAILVDAFRMGTNDPRLLFGAPLLLAGLALLACYVPARKAAKIDPLKALRQE